MLLCSSCHGAHLITHAVEFKGSIDANKLKDSLLDPWCVAVSLLETSGNMANNHLISACIWCNFPSKGPASFVLPLPLPGASAPGKQKAGVLAARSAFQEPVLLYPSSVALAESPQHGTLTLRGYFFGPSPHTTRFPKPHLIATNEYLNNTNLSRHKNFTNNSYLGSLHLPQFNLLTQSQSHNYRPGADHHYLAKDRVGEPCSHAR